MLIVFFRAVILYILIVISIRLMGKRQIGELQPSELVITLLLSNIATLPIEDMTIPMSMGIVPIFTLVCLDVILSHCSLKFRGLRKLICGSPKIVVSRGIIDQKQLKDLRFSADDLLESLRSMGIFDINEVQLAVVETTGKISVYQKAQFRPVNNGGMGIKGSQTDPPQLVVDNGRIIYSALGLIGKDEKWLMKKLGEKGMPLKDVYICTADPSGQIVAIRKDKGILTVIAAMSVFSVFAVKKENDKFISLVNAAENSYRNEDSDTAQRLEELENAWNKYYVRISYIAQSCTLDDISYAVAKLPALLEKGSEEFLSECESIRSWTEKIYHTQYPHLYSVF